MQKPDELDDAGLFRKPHTFRPPNQPREIVPNSEATPAYKPKTLLIIGFYAFMGELIIGAFFYGCYLLVMEVTR